MAHDQPLPECKENWRRVEKHVDESVLVRERLVNVENKAFVLEKRTDEHGNSIRKINMILNGEDDKTGVCNSLKNFKKWIEDMEKKEDALDGIRREFRITFGSALLILIISHFWK